LHLAVDHRRPSAVGHCLDNALCKRDLGWIETEHALGNLDL
jgi:hypothetical protein